MDKEGQAFTILCGRLLWMALIMYVKILINVIIITSKSAMTS